MWFVAAVIAGIVVAAIAIGTGAVLARRRRASDTPSERPGPAGRSRPEPEPMTGLEDALTQVTDRSGTTMRERLDAKADHVEQLRDPGDTGPVLRRALDHVSRSTLADQGDISPATPDAADPDDVE